MSDSTISDVCDGARLDRLDSDPTTGPHPTKGHLMPTPTILTPRRSRWWSLAIGGSAAVALAILTACGNATVPVDPQSAPPTSSAPSTTSAGTDLVEVDGRQLEVPAGFTFPAGAAVSTSFPGTVILSAPAPAEVIAFYRSALPKAGYAIETDVSDTLTWAGRGFGGTVAAETSDTVVTFGAVAADSPSASAGQSEEPGMLTPADLGVRHVPFFLRFPAGSTIENLQDPPTGASFTVTTPDPASMLPFYRAALPAGHFTVTDEVTDGEVTTLTFTDSDGWQGKLVIGPDDTRASFTAPKEEKVLTGNDLGVSHLPFFFRFPDGTKLTGLKDPASGASFTFASPGATEVVDFYRSHLSPHFEITNESGSGDNAVIDFADADDGWTGTITIRDGKATVRFTAP